MNDKNLFYERVSIACLDFLVICMIYAQLLAKLPLPCGVLSLLAISGGMLIGFVAVILFIRWIGSDRAVADRGWGEKQITAPRAGKVAAKSG